VQTRLVSGAKANACRRICKMAIPAMLCLFVSSIVMAQSPDVGITAAQDSIKSLLQRAAALRDSLNLHGAALLKSSPDFAPKSAFENDVEYARRISAAMPQLVLGYRSSMAATLRRLKEIRGRRFSTSNLTIVADPKKYDANTETWDITVKHGGYQLETFNASVKIPRAKAQILSQRLDSVTVSGKLAIDLDGIVRLASFVMTERASGLRFATDMQPIIRVAHSSGISAICFSPDGRALFGASYYEVIKLDIRTGIRTKSGTYQGIECLSACPDRDLLAAGDWMKMHIVSEKDMQNIATYNGKAGSWCSTLSLSPQGLWLCAEFGGDLYLIDSRENRAILELSGAKGGVYAYGGILDPCGRFIVYGNNTYVKRYDFRMGGSYDLFTTEAAAHHLELSPDGSLLAVISSIGKLYTRNLGSESALNIPSIKERVQAVCFSPDGREIAIAIENVGIQICDLSQGTICAYLPAVNNLKDMAFSPDGSSLGIANDKSMEVYRISRIRKDPSRPNAPEPNTISIKTPGTCWTALISEREARSSLWEAWHEKKGAGEYFTTPHTYKNVAPGIYGLIVYDPASGDPSKGTGKKSDGIVIKNIIMENGGTLEYDFKPEDFKDWNCLSCPWIYAHNGKDFVPVGEILVDQASKRLEGTTHLILPNDLTQSGMVRIQIRELKDEITYLDALTMRIGEHVVYPEPSLRCARELAGQDSEYAILKKGDIIYLEFRLGRDMLSEGPAVLDACGYYEPDSLMLKSYLSRFAEGGN
jgi:WD40 repeat protein